MRKRPGIRLRFEHFIILAAVAAAVWFAFPIPRRQLYPPFRSFKVTDRNGQVLREVLSRDYKTSVWIPLEKISPHLIQATLLEEDRRFFLHHGVDPLALARALFDNIRHGRVVSGGSTVTMQVAKMALGTSHRDFLSKLREVLLALKIELHLGKRRILEIYLNRTPYGNQTYGAEAAANLYFRKPARDLSAGEACLLAVIPKSPVRLNPLLNASKTIEAKQRLLAAMISAGKIDSLTFLCAMAESSAIMSRDLPFTAPHFVDYVLAELGKTGPAEHGDIGTTLDLTLQHGLEQYLITTLGSLGPYHVGQGAAIVLDNETGEILAMVGSRDYFAEPDGQVNGSLALRQPGSSIKPFLYILALESGIPASTVMPDTFIEFRLADGSRFAPRNYGERFHGPTRVREALASSFNIPAVYLLDRIGVQNFHGFLQQLHFESLQRESQFYGLALGLGAGEVSLLEITNAFRAIAAGGMFSTTRWREQPTAPAKRVFSTEAAAIVTSILADNASRAKAFGDDSPLNLPFPCAAKTGTSKDFRDNWCVGFSSRYTVGVWVGNFDGSPMQGVSGISGAGPLFRDIMIELHRERSPVSFPDRPSLVRRTICARSGQLPGPFCHRRVEELFIASTEPADTCPLCPTQNGRSSPRPSAATMDRPLRITVPSDGDIYSLDPQVSISAQALALRVETDQTVERLVFELDRQVLDTRKPPFVILWPPVPGEHLLKVYSTADVRLADSVRFRVY